MRAATATLPTPVLSSGLGRGLVAALAFAVPMALAADPALAADDVPREAPPGERAVLDHGHLDLAARVVDGRLKFSVKDGSVPGSKVWREPSDLVLHFGPAHRFTIPTHEEIGGNPIYDVLGKPGDVLWKDGEGNDSTTMLWPGWSTETLDADDLTGPVTVTLAKAEGPGRFVHAQWADDPEWGMKFRLDYDTADGLPDAVELPFNTHAHPLWYFDTEGVYRITLRMSATLPSGEQVSDEDTFAVAVGNVDPSTVEPGDGKPDEPSPTPTPTPTPTRTPTPTPTSTPTGSASPSATATAGPTPSMIPTPSPAPTRGTTAPPSAPSPSVPVESVATGGSAPLPAPAGPQAPAAAGGLAATGAAIALPAGLAAGAVAAGGAAVWVARRKRAAR
ncbi:choice-of-anchor M domain-containing protein [Streptomyces sp. APSN-46.1]|uniref:choice-of-anchor M domain-containing protein n=1 Tax=Streptomyces sp. APSN-46.1 TaxID=2929049 RepID=UPI001FB48C1F|nr:choice-of-anchor M domain-containing protein [Streptomyces sp. APSN-46.1]MCJ1680404.1 choice-of-anchor M domain-containing protein [Streptomyces sp. APSN-46.1]